jgi:c-di-GMP-binding flagellar brake protein YcgR
MGEPGGTSSSQRREYFRARIRLSLLIPTQRQPRLLEGVPYLPPTKSGTDYRILRVRDLSGGGCCCEATDDWPAVGSRLTGYLYLDDGRGPLDLDLLVLRRQDDEAEESEVALVAFRFLEMRESKRQRILRVLFREYRRGRQQPGEP